MSTAQLLERPDVQERQEREWIVLDPPVSFPSQDAMRFGARFYTNTQSAMIEQAVASRTELLEPPLPLED